MDSESSQFQSLPDSIPTQQKEQKQEQQEQQLIKLCSIPFVLSSSWQSEKHFTFFLE